jgi:hypothetical protein
LGRGFFVEFGGRVRFQSFNFDGIDQSSEWWIDEFLFLLGFLFPRTLEVTGDMCPELNSSLGAQIS